MNTFDGSLFCLPQRGKGKGGEGKGGEKRRNDSLLLIPHPLDPMSLPKPDPCKKLSIITLSTPVSFGHSCLQPNFCEFILNKMP